MQTMSVSVACVQVFVCLCVKTHPGSGSSHNEKEILAHADMLCCLSPSPRAQCAVSLPMWAQAGISSSLCRSGHDEIGTTTTPTPMHGALLTQHKQEAHNL